MAEEIVDPPQAETVTEGAAVATRPKSQLQAVEGGVLPVLPRNVPEATQYANGLIAADIVPSAFRYSKDVLPPVGSDDTRPIYRKGDINKALVVMGVLKCLEIGVAPQTGLGGLLPLNGRFSVWGDLAVALVQRHGLVAKQTEAWYGPAIDENAPLGDWPKDAGCEVRYWRVGQDQPYIGRYSVRDAIRAGLWMNSSKEPWIKYPKRMLFNRARAFALRDGFADGLHGLSIAEEVMDALPVVEAEASGSSNMDALASDADQSTNGAGDNASETGV